MTVAGHRPLPTSHGFSCRDTGTCSTISISNPSSAATFRGWFVSSECVAGSSPRGFEPQSDLALSLALALGESRSHCS